MPQLQTMVLPLRPSVTAIRTAFIAGQRRKAHSARVTNEASSFIDSILIANRGEIALRVNRTASAHGIRTTTLYTDADAHAQHAKSSPWSFNLGPTAAYLDQGKILSIAKQHKCKAIHPGYGFLSENADFARRCAEEGITFIGPPASAIEDMREKARAAALAAGYEGAGTVEFIFDNDSGEFFFMEMNTRLQVEHPVTEMVTGLDLVHWQIMVAEGKPLPLTQEEVEERIAERGHAIEARIYAENPDKAFVPDSGRLLHVQLPKESADVRIDTGFVQGDEVTSHYDPMISKLIVRGETRNDAVRKLAMALKEYEIACPATK